MKKFPDIVSVFPLSNFIMFPNTTVPLNIFEPRYIDMINDSMKAERLIGMIQPNYKDDKKNIKPDLYQVGCLGKIINFQETKNGDVCVLSFFRGSPSRVRRVAVKGFGGEGRQCIGGRGGENMITT